MPTKKTRVINKIRRLEVFENKDLCACNGRLCDGICRLKHTQRDRGIKCNELYSINDELNRLVRKLKREDKQNARRGNAE